MPTPCLLKQNMYYYYFILFYFIFYCTGPLLHMSFSRALDSACSVVMVSGLSCSMWDLSSLSRDQT